MPRQYCFLCASDDGVFLDITADNKQIFHEQFEICSLVKVPTVNELSTKICHKCAYELNQCSSFVQKYKLARKQRTSPNKQCCSFCLEPARNEFIFDLSKDQSLGFNSVEKIQKLFNYELGKSCENHKLICLACRYTVDVLLDLKNVCKETSLKFNKIVTEGVDYLTLPKIKTTVVSRKTTITEAERADSIEESENDFDNMTRTRSQNNKLSNKKPNASTKLQICNKCQNHVKAGEDMYKIQGKGNNVCKNCWSMEVKRSESKSKVHQNSTETKQCAVILTDILKNSEVDEESPYKIDQDGKEHKTNIVAEGNSANEHKPHKLTKAGSVQNPAGKQGLKRSVRSVKEQDVEEEWENTPNKKSKFYGKGRGRIVRQTKLRSCRNTNYASSLVHSGKGSGILTKHKRATGSSLSDADVDNKRNRRKLNTISRSTSTRRKPIDVSDDSSSNDDALTGRKRIRVASTSSVTADLIPNSTTRKSGDEKIVPRKRGRPRKHLVPESAKSGEAGNIFETETYVCDECGASYENKLMGLTHKLTHYKQLKIKLQKISSESVEEETPSLSVDIDDQSEDPIETLDIRIDDDEEETVEQSDNLSTNIQKENSSDSKGYSSKRETVEDDVDVELVLKESDDDHSQETEKELQEDEQAEASVTNSAAPDKTVVDEETQRKDNAEKDVRDLADGEDANSQVQEIVHCNNKGAVEEYEKIDKETDEEKRNERTSGVKTKNGEDVVDVDATATDENNDNVSVKANEEKKMEPELAVGQEAPMSNEEILKPSKSNSKENILDANGVDSGKEVECNGTEFEEMGKAKGENTNVINKQAPEFSEETELSTKKTEAVKDAALLEEDKIIDKDEVNVDDLELSKSSIHEEIKSVHDSVNAAAEVLREVLELATAEAERRQGSLNKPTVNKSDDFETLENISSEIKKDADMPQLKLDDAKSETDMHPN